MDASRAVPAQPESGAGSAGQRPGGRGVTAAPPSPSGARTGSFLLPDVPSAFLSLLPSTALPIPKPNANAVFLRDFSRGPKN